MTPKTYSANGGNHSTDETSPNYTSPSTRQATLGDIARLLGGKLVGDAGTLITGVSGLESATPGTISFVDNEKLLHEALASAASALILPSAAEKEFRNAARKGGKPVVLAGNPRLAFAKVIEYLQPANLPEQGIHPTAVIEPDAYIGENVTIREFCYVGHQAHIGDGAVLYPHATVGDGAQIGDGTHIHYSVVVYPNVHIGKRVRIHANSVIGSDGFGYVFHEGKHHKVPQVGTVLIEDDVEIGANVCVDRAMLGATRIGEGSKIDNLVQVAHNVQIGRDCIVCALVGLSGSVVIEDNVMIAGQVGVRDHIRVAKKTVVAAQAGVISNTEEGDYLIGSPAVPNREFMRMEAASRKLPDTLYAVRRLEKQVKELEKKLAQLDENSSDHPDKR
jgi:UDP-3-O-[3-hydroxymyristoyl] glucosamine N-acyltransferase